jgi:hypothetical protein
MRLENWELFWNLRLAGEVYDSLKFPQGSHITTTKIVKVDKENQLITTECGSVYELGVAHEKYEATYPNARARLFKEYQNVNH